MDNLLSSLSSAYPQLNFKASDDFCWSPREQIIYYAQSEAPPAAWTLLHETSHGILQHTTFTSDFELLRLEIAAWELAKTIAGKLGVHINEDHIEDCLDTYRDWLHRRSLCPNCQVKSLQINEHMYGCLNCNTRWRVSSNRLCRPYRARIHTNTAL